MYNSDIIILKNNHKSHLLFTNIYDFKIIEVELSLDGTALTLMIFLKSVCGQYKDVVYQEFLIDSQEFQEFIQIAYAEERNTVIDICSKELKRLTGKILIEDHQGEIVLRWKDAVIETCCHGTAFNGYNESSDDEELFFIFDNRHSCHLLPNKKYRFNILKASFNPKRTALQLIILLRKKDQKDIIFEEIPLNSEKFWRFVKCAYPMEFTNVINFDLSRLCDFSGNVYLKQYNGQRFIDWENIDIDTSPLSDGWQYTKED